MANAEREYFDFYLMGRDEAEDDADNDREIDFAALGKSVVAGEDVREVAMGAARKAGVEETDMAAWRKSSRRLRKAIDDAGGDTARAYRLYSQGYIDGLAHAFELEILSAIEDGDDDAQDDEGDEPDDADDDED
jgi:hypothetical protein